MNIFDNLFFSIYNFFYKDGNYDRNKIGNPLFHSVSIFVIGTLGWIMIFIFLFDFLFKNGKFVEENKFMVEMASGMMLSYVVYWFLFVLNDRYQKIYEKFKNKNFTEKTVRRTQILSITFLFMPYALLIIATFVYIAFFRVNSNH
jgi:hypothetical protein